MAKTHPIAALAERANTETVSRPAPAALKTGNAITGQFLYDQFVTESKADLTKIDIVLSAVELVDTATFKAALADMVKIAKESGNEAKHRTAANNQSALRVLYGALKFARDALDEKGFKPGRVGYHEARVMAAGVLKERAITWEGYPTETEQQREARRATKMQQKILKEVQDANPQQAGEDLATYFERIKELAVQRLETAQREADAEKVAKLADRVIEMCGDLLGAVMTDIAARVRDIAENRPAAE